MAGLFKTVTFMALVFAAVVFAEDYDVGDDAKWSRPTDLEFYNTWAAGKTFLVGDELEFEFDAERHNVAIVTADAYENCDKETPLSLITTSPAKIMLNETGPQYFICTSGDHCRFGQKLTVNVVDDAGGHSGGGGAGATPPGPGDATTPAPGGGATTPGPSGATTPATPGGATAPGAEGTSPSTTPGAGATAPTGSSETTTPPSAASTASSLGGASFMVAFVSAVVSLF